ncbi:hypothetical protein ScPMuIL_012176 [Solemya velum]
MTINNDREWLSKVVIQVSLLLSLSHHIASALGSEEEDLAVKMSIPDKENALPGRSEKMSVSEVHAFNGNPLVPPFPAGMELAMFGMGCFWGAERLFWKQPGVYSTQVGYTAGFTSNPLYDEVCCGRTGHVEAVRVVFDPEKTTFSSLLKVFWENHNPTEGMKQGNDMGSQYRSGIYYYDEEQKIEAEASRTEFQKKLLEAGYGDITTEIREATEFFYAEDYHQQYLHKNPDGYCGLKATGVSCPESCPFSAFTNKRKADGLKTAKEDNKNILTESNVNQKEDL